jgi:endonuclease III-like uncharacterized protein
MREVLVLIGIGAILVVQNFRIHAVKKDLEKLKRRLLIFK